MEYTDLKYDKKRVIDERHLDKESKQVLQWIGFEKYVLEVGCHTGCLSEWMQKKGCEVYGVDINENAIRVAHPFLKQSKIGNVEDANFWDKLNNEKFDVITFMHVLEHLVDPWETLRNSRNTLKKSGEVIIALPNINNAKDRFNILFGRFDYTLDGVMDKTHLRFFNQQTARQLIDEAGFDVIDYYSPWQVNPIHHFIDHLPIFWRLKRLFRNFHVPWMFRKQKNITDVVMLFRCRMKNI